MQPGHESMAPMDDGDIERFEEEREMELYREYRDVLPMFAYVIETERRFYLANKVEMLPVDLPTGNPAAREILMIVIERLHSMLELNFTLPKSSSLMKSLLPFPSHLSIHKNW